MLLNKLNLPHGFLTASSRLGAFLTASSRLGREVQKCLFESRLSRSNVYLTASRHENHTYLGNFSKWNL